MNTDTWTATGLQGDNWFDMLDMYVSWKAYHRQKFYLQKSNHWYIESNRYIIALCDDAYNSIAPMYTFNPVTEKYEGSFTLLQIWEHLL